MSSAFQADSGDRMTKKGKLYSCLHCEKSGKSYREARYRVVGHILKHHRSLDQTPYYCSLCMFRCTTSDALRKHVTGYKRHELMAQGDVSDSSRYLVENPTVKAICEGADYRVLTLREQYSSTVQEEDPLNIVDECLLSEFDALDEPMLATAQPAQHLPNSTGQPGDQQLVTVQVTPDMLSQLLQPKPATVQYPGQVFQNPPLVQRQLKPFTQGHTSQPQTNSADMPLASVSTWPASTFTKHQLTQQMPNPGGNTPLLDEVNAVIGFPTPDNTMLAKKTPTPKQQLNTPKPTSPENIMTQLLGNVPLSPSFSEVEVARPIKTKPLATQSRSSQTEPEPKKAKTEIEDSKAIMETIGKITTAIDWNSRAIRNQDKTLSQVVDVLTRLGKSVERIADGLHKRNSSPRRKENTSPRSPNRKTLKSVVNKK